MSQARVAPAPAAAMTSTPDTPAPSAPSLSTIPPAKHKLGPLEISVNWRTRAEGGNWCQGDTGNSDYGLWNSLLRVGIGQTGRDL